jgi:CRP/FNR family transcriptional regulator, cyclic AMP receptor protein
MSDSDRGAGGMVLLDLWKAVGLFNGLSNEQLEHLVNISQEERFNDGDVVFRQDADGDKLYFICEGQVEILIQKTPKDPARSQIFLGRGQIIGEMALVDLGKRSATVRCCQNGTVLRSISHEAFNELCATDTAIGFVIMRNMAMELSFKLRHSNLNLGAGS